jgi:hypothetical protein
VAAAAAAAAAVVSNVCKLQGLLLCTALNWPVTSSLTDPGYCYC